MSCFSWSFRSRSRDSTRTSASPRRSPRSARLVPACYPEAMSSTEDVVTVSARGAARLRGGHPWVYAEDVARAAGGDGGDIVRVVDGREATLGTALWAPGTRLPL